MHAYHLLETEKIEAFLSNILRIFLQNIVLTYHHLETEKIEMAYWISLRQEMAAALQETLVPGQAGEIPVHG